MRRSTRRRSCRSAGLVAVLAALGFVLAGSPAAHATASAREGPVGHRLPAEGTIVDAFRPPASPWGPGNRGIDLATEPGAPVRASAAGRVVFAGPVGGSRHVVVLHPDGIRTSYSFLAEVAVVRGQPVTAGEVVGRSAGRFHFGARAGDTYLDPLLLLGGGPPRVELVPVAERRPRPVAAERRGLVRQLTGRLGDVARVVTDADGAARWLVERAGDAAGTAVELHDRAAGEAAAAAGALARRGRVLLRAEVQARLELALLAGHYLYEANPATAAVRLADASRGWLRARDDCTPAGRPPPPPPPGPRVLVLVGGLGTSSTTGSLHDLDHHTLGYDAADVVHFSYRGGQASGDPAVAPVRAYVPRDTAGDIRLAAGRLRELLAHLHRTRPGATVDVVGHSLGGVVVREALAHERDPADPRLPELGAVVTLGAPYGGADLAGAAHLLRESGPVGELLARARVGGLPPRGPAVHQLSPGSLFQLGSRLRPVPSELDVRSIAARVDPVVPSVRSTTPGARAIVVDEAGLHAHGGLVRAPATHRELALAVAGAPPTCRDLADRLVDAAVGHHVALAESGLALVGATAVHRVDHRLTPPVGPADGPVR